MVNPLDLRGPEFLLFYAVIGLAVLVWLLYARGHDEDGESRRTPRLSDPYLIAYLRGGSNEAVRVACVSLVDRGLLEVADDGTLRTKPHVNRLPIRLEQEIVDLFRNPIAATVLFDDPAIRGACRGYDEELTQLGLLPNEATMRARRRRLAPALALLLGLALAKMAVGLSRGRPIGFLILLAGLFALLAIWMHNARQTGSGRALIADLRRLFARLKQRAATLKPGASSSDTALLVAVYGLGALPAARFSWARRVFPKTSGGAMSWGGGGSCGSSCGSSCGGGGGCGGCGGCGGGGD